METKNKKLPNRHSIRLANYDYSSDGWYFVTTCTHKGEHLFGTITDGKMKLNQYGIIVQECWNDLTNHYSNIVLHDFCIMPNHFHGIIEINNDKGTIRAGLKPAPTDLDNVNFALSEIVRGFKTFSSQKINRLRQSAGESVWQRNYFEHVIRSEKSYYTLVNYIHNNALRWSLDKLNNMGE